MHLTKFDINSILLGITLSGIALGITIYILAFTQTAPPWLNWVFIALLALGSICILQPIFTKKTPNPNSKDKIIHHKEDTKNFFRRDPQSQLTPEDQFIDWLRKQYNRNDDFYKTFLTRKVDLISFFNTSKEVFLKLVQFAQTTTFCMRRICEISIKILKVEQNNDKTKQSTPNSSQQVTPDPTPADSFQPNNLARLAQHEWNTLLQYGTRVNSTKRTELINELQTLKDTKTHDKIEMLTNSGLAKKIHLAKLMEVIANPTLSQTSKHTQIDQIFKLEQAARQAQNWSPLKPLDTPTLAK